MEFQEKRGKGTKEITEEIWIWRNNGLKIPKQMKDINAQIQEALVNPKQDKYKENHTCFLMACHHSAVENKKQKIKRKSAEKKNHYYMQGKW